MDFNSINQEGIPVGGKEMKLLIIGNGVLASMVTKMLSWTLLEPKQVEIIIGTRNSLRGKQLVNLASLSSLNLNNHITIRHVNIDLDNVEETSCTLKELNPDIIFNTATMQSYWVISSLPEPIYKALSLAGIGPWIPMHLAPVYKLMKAYKQSGIKGIVINSAFPDAINPALKTLGLSPDIGIGNVANIVPAIQSAIALKHEINVHEVHVKMVCHHAVSNAIPSQGQSKAPYILEARDRNGEDLLVGISHDDIFNLVKTELTRPRGKDGMWITASSAARLIQAFTNKEFTSVHAPGPMGLIGGYPLQIKAGQYQFDLPEDVTLEQAIQINKLGQQFDGIQEITEDGRVILMDASVEIVHSVLGYYCKNIDTKNIEVHAWELASRYKKFAEKWELIHA
ncbi:hypothetical protein [Fastidiosibacter lacustris]|uniref:hypothetical protein n=1 Tax=Fastidiosibacter lacustris TaxID=2056695 RepID=UPI000E347D7D|nr:hypothetical protein [Fastidiosibacter lacustris]